MQKVKRQGIKEINDFNNKRVRAPSNPTNIQKASIQGEKNANSSNFLNQTQNQKAIGRNQDLQMVKNSSSSGVKKLSRNEMTGLMAHSLAEACSTT